MKKALQATGTMQGLSESRRKLVRLMQEINFGRIEHLMICAGEPVLTAPAPRVVLEVKLAGENGPRPERGVEDFALKAPVVDFLAHLQRLQNATIELLTIKHGLPFLMHVQSNV